ncbi:MAG: 2Fe-2S iron-sulfur cluster-binding protein [Candidatus Kapaibacterium sp.]
MPVLTINGQKIEAQAGKTIIEAAHESGMHIPHFCWHPSLSVAGNCRMCLVNVGSPKKGADGAPELDENGQPVVAWMPKLQIACSTPVADGMIVSTADEKSEKASNAVMEFLLINHPLDCPICDEAGQCKLQEYAYKYSKGESRFVEGKNHKDKRVAWGPNVMFDGERCISCSRCIRYATEIAQQPVLSFVQRGDHVTIETFEGTQFDSPYSMNVIELCPVGALTSIDFRFKARVWDMSFNDSVCPGCARGCNMSIGVRDNTILRLEPRANLRVNNYWMCDAGRTTQYSWVNNNRLTGAHIRNAGSLHTTDWNEAFTTIASNLKNSGSDVLFIVGGKCTNEDAYAAQKFAKNVVSSKNVVYVRRNDPAFADSFLRVADRNANSRGFESMGITGIEATDVASKIRSSKAVVVLCDDALCADPAVAEALASCSYSVVLSPNVCSLTNAASAALGASTYAEVEGTFTNIDGRVQHFTPAVVTTENLRRMGMKMSRLDKFGAQNDRWTQGEKRDSRPAWMILQGIAKASGSEWSYTNASSVFGDIASSTTGMEGMSYDLLDQRNGVVLHKVNDAEPEAVVYESHYMKP